MSILGIIAFENLLPEYQNQKAIFTTGTLKLLSSTELKNRIGQLQEWSKEDMTDW